MEATKRSALSAAVLALCIGAPSVQAQSPAMTFFITSATTGNGADYGGLEGADKHCQALAIAAGAGGHTWHAYLSTQGADAANARERIGNGPWQNAKGVVIARNLDELHSGNNINRETGLTEKGEHVNSRWDPPPLKHDILTGSTPEGTAFPADEDKTCGNWTKSSGGSAIVGHFDRSGTTPGEAGRSWNSSHPTKGCGESELPATGSAGLLYCFAVK